jgi:hypothetical protein
MVVRTAAVCISEPRGIDVHVAVAADAQFFGGANGLCRFQCRRRAAPTWRLGHGFRPTVAAKTLTK